MSQQQKLVLRNNEIIFKQYLGMRVIDQSYTTEKNSMTYSFMRLKNIMC